MDTTLSSKNIDHLREVLLERRTQLESEVDEGLERRHGEENFAIQAGEVPDSGDTSVALEVSDLRNAEIARDVAELTGIRNALSRMDSGDYGVCTTCGTDIPLARLVASPTAERCIKCQTLYEAQHATVTGTGI